MDYPKIDFLYLSEPDMIKAGVNDPVKCTDCMIKAMTREKKYYLMQKNLLSLYTRKLLMMRKKLSLD